MKKITISLVFIVLLVGIFFIVNAQEAFLNPDVGRVGIPEFLSGFYKFAIMISGILAVGMIVVGGIYITLSGASPDKKNEGKSMILGALWGLALVLGAYLILKTLNPGLVLLESPGEGILQVATYEKCSSSTVVISEKGGTKTSKTLDACKSYEYPIDFETGECTCYVDKEWLVLQVAFDERVANEPDSDLMGGVVGSKGRGCMKNTFGKNAAEVQKNLVSINCAGMQMQVHKLAKKAFETACAKIPSNAVTKCNKKIENSGTFNWRYIAGTKTLSYHSWGIALDISAWGCNFCDNVRRKDCYAYSTKNICSPPSLQKICTNPNLPNTVINAFKDSGFGWGGDWNNKVDNMHFEWFGSCTK